MGIPVKDLQVASALDGTTRPPELDRHDDQPDQPHDEEDEGAHHDNGRQQAAVGDEPEDAADAEYGNRSNGDVVWEIPVEFSRGSA